MAAKITYHEKIRLLEAYIDHPQGLHDVAILAAIKADVVRCAVPGTKKGASVPPADPVYNTCMGLYRHFLQSRGLTLDLRGKKARNYKEAMTNLLLWIRKYQAHHKKGRIDADTLVIRGVRHLFSRWDQLPEFHRNRIGLPDIYQHIEEIIKQLKHGSAKKTGPGHTLPVGGQQFGKL